MALPTCPKCGVTLDRRRMPPRYPWTLVYTFRCQSCATMLRWDMSRRTNQALPWLFLFGLAVSVGGLTTHSHIAMIALPLG